MCLPDQLPEHAARPTPGSAGPVSAADAVAMTKAGLAFLAAADMTSVAAAAQADCLRALEAAGAMHVAARARVLSAFAAGRGFEDDGQGSAGAWLRWQTRITRGAAAGAVGWARRLAAHPSVGDALAAGDISASWAREICGWSDRLPADRRADADEVLLGAAAGGAELADLAGLAEEMYRRCAPPDSERDGGFADRWLRLGVTFRSAGRLEGDLSPQCTAALTAVLEALGKKAGPEDTRTKGQRDHDALEEACRRLIGAGCLPERAGQPTQIQLHMTLDQLRGLPGAGAAEAAWAARGPAAAPGSGCDASVVPVVSGYVDPAVLDRLATALRGRGADPRFAEPRFPGVPQPADRALAAAATRAALLRYAADLLSGPAGLAAYLRTGQLDGVAGSISLPLDIGKATEEIPAHLRRVVIARDRHCRFPGCWQPPAACQVHHIRPRRKGGRTSLTNMILLCAFHHLIAVHRWGWTITLSPDGTVTALSPDRQRTLHSHGPPARAA
jgi:Domain of unknown function (DUF222)/HNH endonuclease